MTADAPQAPPPGRGAAPADEPRTVVEARTVAEPREAPGAALPVGQALQEFVIEGLVGEGGFGIVYLARDTRLDRVVALKEYMPTNLAQRGSDRSVSVRSERYRETFVLGLRSFVNEAKLLASFDHPSLVKVYRFWEENGTAYMVMPYYEGPTLRQKLHELKEPPDEAWLRALLAPLIDALELIHNDHCWHRDIAPDNILLLAPQKTQSGPGPQLRPLLLDFGAARRVIGDVTHNLTVILKPGYAPIEQYAESESMRQGAWTDVYALCAVLYCAITGRAPVPSVSRIIADDMVSAVQAGAGRYSDAFLAAIDTGLAVRPDARPQSMAALRERFAIGRAPSAQGAAAPRSAVPGPGQHAAAMPASPGASAAPDSRAAVPNSGVPEGPRSPRQAGASRAAPGPTGAARARKWPLMIAGFAVLGGAAALFGWWLERSVDARRAPPQTLPQTSAQPAAPSLPQLAAPEAAKAAAPDAPASAVGTTAGTAPADGAASAAAAPAAPAATPTTAAPAPAAAAPPRVAAPAKASAAAPPTTARAPAARAPALASPASPAPARPGMAEPAAPASVAPPTTPTPAAQHAPAPPQIDTKRFECDVLVRAGQKALANRSYDDAMQRADEALAVFHDCPGAAELGRTARQAKDRARSSAVIQ